MSHRPAPLFELREFLFPSNILTALRLLMVLPTFAAMRRPGGARQAALWLAVAMLTDALDGPIARRRGEVSRLGQLLDPIADKLLIDLSAIALAERRGFPRWMVGLLLFRDAGILVCAILVLRRNAQITLSRWTGKAATVGLTASILLHIINRPQWGRPVLYLTLVPFLLSFVQYSRQFLRMVRSG